MIRPKARILAAAAGIAITALAAAGCGPQDGTADASYAPVAYGQVISGRGLCYYVDDPAEAVALMNAGLCPRTWAPAPMPLAWHEEYWDYYDSSAYYGAYVPVRYRTVFVHREAAFGRANRGTITRLSRTAKYRSSAGGTVKGTKITSRARFGSGTSFGTSGQRYGGGSLRNSTRSSSARSGSGGGYSGPRSGSLRSGRH